MGADGAAFRSSAESAACGHVVRAVSAVLRAPDDRAGAARDAELDAAITELASAIRARDADPIGAATSFAPALRARLMPLMRAPTGVWPLRVAAGDVAGLPTLVHATLDRVARVLAEKVLAGWTEDQERRIRELQHENEQLHRVAVRDAKTGLLNYNFFRQRVQQELDRAIRYGMPIAFIMADLDGFKAYNDANGHLFGDRVLGLVAALITQSARSSDLVGRYGGEEFGVLLPQTDLEGALVRADRIRAAIEHASFPAREGKTARLTITLGVAAHPPHADTIDGLIDAADTAMYVAKRGGKNNVAAAERPGVGADATTSD